MSRQPAPAIVFSPLTAGQVAATKRMIGSVAHAIYGWEEPLETILTRFEQQGELADVDDFQAHYVARRGIFLVVLDNDQVVGSGAVRQIDSHICELKRLWLLAAYQGQGIGRRLLAELVAFARAHEYKCMYLETDREQTRAIRFYQHAGFQPIPPYNNNNNDLYMARQLD